MDVFWIILDSLSLAATPFDDDGPNTMPKMKSLADEHGHVFTEAYVPGPKSPSSHGSFFTGQLPSQTGMHEGYPSFDSELPTIADALEDSHRSYLVSSNPFLFNGLDERFDETTFLNDHDSALFNSATDPEEFKWERGHESRFERYKDFVFGGGKPIRSLFNGLHYKFRSTTDDGSLIPSKTELDPLEYQSVETMNEKNQSFLSRAGDALVVANYMDVHPPLNASEDALEQFAAGRSIDELPVGVSGQELQERVQEDGQGSVKDLYHASIWDLDRKLTPLIERLVEEDVFVAVTADHGNWFQPDSGLDDEKLHVPLVLFGPEIHSSTVNKTVNLIQLPATTIEEVGVNSETNFHYPSLLDISTSQVSVTEYIRSEGGGPVNPYGDNPSIYHDIVGIKNNSRVDYSDGEYEPQGDDEHTDEIEKRIGDVLSEMNDSESGSLDYDESTEERLKELGYL